MRTRVAVHCELRSENLIPFHGWCAGAMWRPWRNGTGFLPLFGAASSQFTSFANQGSVAVVGGVAHGPPLQGSWVSLGSKAHLALHR